MKRDTTFENWSTPGTTLFCFMSTRTLVMFPLPNYSTRSAGTRGEGTLSPGSTFLHLNTPKDSLLRSRFFLCHATLPQRSERCVTSHETAAKETSPRIDCFFGGRGASLISLIMDTCSFYSTALTSIPTCQAMEQYTS